MSADLAAQRFEGGISTRNESATVTVVIYDATALPTETDVPDEVLIHIDLPWMTVVTEHYNGSGVKVCLHGDMDALEAEDLMLALSYVPNYALRLEPRSDIRTLGCENEIMASYWVDSF